MPELQGFLWNAAILEEYRPEWRLLCLALASPGATLFTLTTDFASVKGVASDEAMAIRGRHTGRYSFNTLYSLYDSLCAVQFRLLGFMIYVSMKFGYMTNCIRQCGFLTSNEGFYIYM